MVSPVIQIQSFRGGFYLKHEGKPVLFVMYQGVNDPLEYYGACEKGERIAWVEWRNDEIPEGKRSLRDRRVRVAALKTLFDMTWDRFFDQRKIKHLVACTRNTAIVSSVLKRAPTMVTPADKHLTAVGSLLLNTVIPNPGRRLSIENPMRLLIVSINDYRLFQKLPLLQQQRVIRRNFRQNEEVFEKFRILSRGPHTAHDVIARIRAIREFRGTKKGPFRSSRFQKRSR